MSLTEAFDLHYTYKPTSVTPNCCNSAIKFDKASQNSAQLQSYYVYMFTSGDNFVRMSFPGR